MKRRIFAVLLAGAGHLDGSEIHEATLSLWAIHKHGYDYHCFAPDCKQHHVINHLTGEETDKKRNVLEESARIARGKISALSKFDPAEYDALIIPGGFGAAKNLSDYAFSGSSCTLHPEVKRAIQACHAAGKPIGALCIAPILLASALGDAHITLGSSAQAAQDAMEMGAKTSNCDHGQIIIDQTNKLVTTPCYMLDARVDQIGDGADALIEAVSTMLI